jgi:hypothetical protein
MAERPWRIEVGPVVRREAAPMVSAPELVPIPLTRRRPWHRAAAIVVVGLIAIGVLKPWGGASPDAAVTPATPAPRQQAATPVPSLSQSADLARPANLSLPLAVFAPPASHCMEDIGWHVCVVGEGDRQTTRNTFAPDAPFLTDRTGDPKRVEPAVVLSTSSGAAIAFYPPAGFYTPLESPARDEFGTDPQVVFGRAWGPIAISAWRIDADRGTHGLDLDEIGALSSSGLVASNVLVPRDDGFLRAPTWPNGRYVVWLVGGGVESWQEFFDFQIAPRPSATGP